MKDLKISNKTVLVLVDFFLPLERVVPTLRALAKNKNKVIAVSVFLTGGLENPASKLAEELGRKFIILHDNVLKLPEYDIPHLYFSPESRLLSQMRPGDIAVVENLNLLSKEAIIQLKGLVQVFVNDSFGAPEDAVRLLSRNLPVLSGLEFVRMKKSLDLFLSRTRKPLVLVLGGVKFFGKETALDKLMRKADAVLIGGGIANLFFKIQGLEIGKSVFDWQASEKTVKKLWRDYRAKIKLPLDVVVTTSGPKIECVKPNMVKRHQKILDIGPATTLEFSKSVKQGKTLVWCGVLGQAEEKKFSHGTRALLRLFASRPQSSRMSAASGETALSWLTQAGFLGQVDVALPSSFVLLKALAD